MRQDFRLPLGRRLRVLGLLGASAVLFAYLGLGDRRVELLGLGRSARNGLDRWGEGWGRWPAWI